MICMTIIDCERCLAPAGSCDDCVVRSMLYQPAELNSDEQAALSVLAMAKMVPPLRWTTDENDPNGEKKWRVA